ncbi:MULTISPECIES: DUF2180 family protein [Nocardiopsis]|uniref:DUF2180 family protein n=1 Tax=Nocardiopsis TaxID=2013 RepID=UPI0033EEFEE1
MQCYDCAHEGKQRTAVGICQVCGAALCVDHAHETAHVLSRPASPGAVERAEPARRLLCERCRQAQNS